jgi:hypothetical protein
MPLGPLAVTALLALLDWAAWEWAISTNHPTIGLIAGLFMAPIAVGFVWALGRVGIALAQLGLRRATTPRERPSRPVAPAQTRRPSVPFDIEAQDERVAA